MDNPHGLHSVAKDPEREDLLCFDCEVYFPRQGYRSPFKTGEPPYYLWRDIKIPASPS